MSLFTSRAWFLFVAMSLFSACLLAQPAQSVQPAAPQAATDDRDPTEISIYTGLSIDSFAAAELNSYINPNDANKLKSVTSLA